MRTLRPAVLVTAGVVALVVAVPGIGLAAYHHDKASLRALPKHTTVGGIDVSGLKKPEALDRVRATVNRQLDKRVSLVVAGQTYSATMRQLGVRDNTVQAVEKAFVASRKGSWMSRTWHRIFGGHSSPSVQVDLTRPSTAQLQKLVDRAAADNSSSPVDASAYLSGGFVSFTHAKPGLALDKTAAMAALQQSLRDGRPHEAPVKVVQPTVTDADLGTVILIRANENKLYVYKDGHIARTFRVATGTTKYPTPLGHFSVTLKRYLPTWYNPHSEWSKDEPETIPPGPHNPLGLRALNLSANGIRIHGSPADYSIGYNASHGCIRMHNSDVIQLFPMIPTGAQVFITRVGPYHPLPVKKTPPKPTDKTKPPTTPPPDIADGG